MHPETSRSINCSKTQWQSPSRKSSFAPNWEQKSPALFSARNATRWWPVRLPWCLVATPTCVVALFVAWVEGVAVCASYPTATITSWTLSTVARSVTPFLVFANLKKGLFVILWVPFSSKQYFLSQLTLDFVLFKYKLCFCFNIICFY